MSVADDKTLLCFFFQAKSSMFESVGYEGGHRKSLIPIVTFEVLLFISHGITTSGNLNDPKCLEVSISFLFHSQVKQESLGISTKMSLKVDVESGKLYFKKQKDGPEDKYFVHNKSKKSYRSVTSFFFIFSHASVL